MKKSIVFASAVAVVGISAFLFKDPLYEKYLQENINPNLTIDSDGVKFCGYSINSDETPEQLVHRVANNFNGPQTLRKIIETVSNTMADSPEIEKLNGKIEELGWRSDEDLAKDIAEYKDKSYMKETLNRLIKQQELRKSAVPSREELIAERINLRSELFNTKQESLSRKVSYILNQAACETGDNSINDELNSVVAASNPKLSEAERDSLEAHFEEQTSQNLTLAVEPLKAFTDKLLHFLNDAVGKFTPLDSKISFKEYSITNTQTVAVANAFGKKKLYEVSCTSTALSFKPIFGTSKPYKCSIKESGKKYDSVNIYLYDLEMAVEEYNDDKKWSKVKELTLEQLK